MDYAEHILTLSTTIMRMVENTKANKERCRRVADRVRSLEGLVLTIKQRGPGQISGTVERALMELYTILNSAKDVMSKFSQTKRVKSFLKSSSIEEKFNEINQRLTENFLVLSGALQIEHTNILNKVYESVSEQRGEEDVCRLMASPTVPMLPPAPMPNPTAPMLPPTPLSSPTYPMLPQTPVSSLTNYVLPSVSASSPTTPMPVTCVMPSMPVSTPFMAQPVYNATTSRIIVSNNLGPRPVTISQVPFAGTANTMSVIRTVAPIHFPAQNTPVVPAYVVKNAFLR